MELRKEKCSIKEMSTVLLGIIHLSRSGIKCVAL
jgi:hypothetical protein